MMAGRKGKGNAVPFSLWPDRPGPEQPPLDTDQVEQWDDLEEEDTPGPARKASRREKRNIRGAILNRSFRRWVQTREEAVVC